MKSALEHFFDIFWSLCAEMIWKICLLLNFEILGLFVNIFSADDNYTFGDSGDLQFPIQMQLS